MTVSQGQHFLNLDFYVSNDEAKYEQAQTIASPVEPEPISIRVSIKLRKTSVVLYVCLTDPSSDRLSDEDR